MTAPSDLPVYLYEPDTPDLVDQFADGVTSGYLVLWDGQTGHVYAHAPAVAVGLDGAGFITTNPEEGNPS